MRIYIGWDEREELACRVALRSILQHATVEIECVPLSLKTLGAHYWRPTIETHGKLWDHISNAPMSTSHALARFWIPQLEDYKGFAIFMDGDVLIRRDIKELMALADERYAVQVVKQLYAPELGSKKRGDSQLPYPRKNWSSVMIMNCGHPANRRLDLEVLNSWKGLSLHVFQWLQEKDIGELPTVWNHLITEPALVHFTEGLPDQPGRDKTPYAAEWMELADPMEATFFVRR